MHDRFAERRARIRADHRPSDHVPAPAIDLVVPNEGSVVDELQRYLDRRTIRLMDASHVTIAMSTRSGEDDPLADLRGLLERVSRLSRPPSPRPPNRGAAEDTAR